MNFLESKMIKRAREITEMKAIVKRLELLNQELLKKTFDNNTLDFVVARLIILKFRTSVARYTSS